MAERKQIDQVVIEYISEPNLRMSDGRCYWAFSIYCGEENLGVGSADTFEMCSDMAKEMVRDINAGLVLHGTKIISRSLTFTAHNGGEQ